MNTQQLQRHLMYSLYSLAKACENHKKSSHTDQLILDVLTLNNPEESTLLDSLDEVSQELHLICPEADLQTELGLNVIISPKNLTQQKTLLGGLGEIAATLMNTSMPSFQRENMMTFVYRALQNLGNDQKCQESIREMNIITHHLS